MPPSDTTLIGTAQNPYTPSPPTGNTSALHAPGNYLFKTSPLTLSAGSVALSLPAGPAEANQISIKFHASGGAAKRAQVRITGIRRQPRIGVADDYCGTYLCTLDLVTGSTTVNVSTFGPSGPYNLVGKVNILDDQTNTPPGLRFVGTAEADGWVEVLLDTIGYSTLILELTNIDVTAGNPNPTTAVGFTWTTL